MTRIAWTGNIALERDVVGAADRVDGWTGWKRSEEFSFSRGRAFYASRARTTLWKSLKRHDSQNVHDRLGRHPNRVTCFARVDIEMVPATFFLVWVSFFKLTTHYFHVPL
jgi:hypothetical protein